MLSDRRTQELVEQIKEEEARISLVTAEVVAMQEAAGERGLDGILKIPPLVELWETIYTHRCSPVFREPVNPDEAPGYLNVVKKPMDLRTIKERIDSGAISNVKELYQALLLMVNNALSYNQEGSDICKIAKEMKRFIIESIGPYARAMRMVI